MRFRKMVSLVLAMAFLTLSLQACNTIRGAGKDVERAGEEVQDVTR